jgi:hypothetical protein
MIVRSNEAPPLTKLSAPACLPSKIYPKGTNIFFISNLSGSFLTIRARQMRAFFLIIGVVLLLRARSNMVSDRFERAEGMIVARRESANDCASSFRDRISDSTE